MSVIGFDTGLHPRRGSLPLMSVAILFLGTSVAFGQFGQWRDSSPVGVEGVFIALKGRVIARWDQPLRIGDIAKVSAPSARLVRSIEKLDLRASGEWQREARIGQREVEIRVRLSGLVDGNLNVGGADIVVVQGSNQRQFQAELSERLAKEIARQFGLDSTDVRVQLLDISAVAALEAQLAAGDFAVTAVMGNSVPLGRTQIECNFSTSRGMTFSKRLSINVTVLKRVAVASMPILSGTKIDPSMIQVVKRPLVQNASFVDPDAIVGKIASRDIPSQQLVVASHVNTRRFGRTLVNRGDLIDVMIRIGSSQVRLKDAKVMSPGGNVGDTIEIMNTKTNHRLNAIIDDRTTARTNLLGVSR
jgi:flagella basal body P-ring formation protein FlgA